MPVSHAPSPKGNPLKLLVFDTHPIQYHAPVFRELAKRAPQTRVFLFDEQFNGSKWWFFERNQIPPQTWGVELKQGYPSETLHASQLGYFQFSKKALSILREERPAAVLVFGYFMIENWILWRHCRKLGIPLLYIGDTFADFSSGLRKLVKKWILKVWDRGIFRYVSVGEKNTNYYLKRRVSPNRIARGKYCVDNSFFLLSESERQKRREKWRARHGIPKEAKVLLFLGRMMDRKRPKDVLQVHQLLTRATKLHTVFVGNGPLEAELRRDGANEPGVHFLGFQNQEEIRDCYSGSDLLYVPSNFETWGLVVNEAFCHSVPAIVTDTCGSAEDLVIPGVTGEVIKVGDTHEAARRIEKLFTEPGKLEKLGANARKKVETEFGVEQLAETILSAATGKSF